ncbi:DUF624 domain-containing protein [Mediterraneibacter agrestimuris]|uniref:DUF624 domain-containing protein n=1 Tax=Mediterraneibacter agrestimuris TaxID=2941333 RepID=UPI0020408D9F|nr:DUF624 domain-containing protein [Mediterraneibacter agrestimuris]
MAELFNIERVLGFCERVCYFFMINLLFVVSNLPVLFFLLFVGGSQIRECLPLFLFCMIPMAPALSAVFYSMNRLIHGIEGSAWRDYKRGYCSDFRQTIMLGTGQVFFIFMFAANMEFFAVQVRILPLAVVFAVLGAAAVLVTPNLYMLASRYEMKNLQIVKTGVTLLIARPIATLGNIVSLAIVLMAFELVAGTTVLFMGSVYGFLVMFMNQAVMRNLENSAAGSNSST